MLYIISVHDGADNMMKTSKLLQVNSITTVPHSLHLLLTTDSTSQVSEVSVLLYKCRDIVTTLHFKTVDTCDKISASEDKAALHEMESKLAATSRVLYLDEQFSPSDCNDIGREAGEVFASSHSQISESCMSFNTGQ